MRDRFPLLLVGLLALLAVLGVVLTAGARRGAFADRFSTFRSEPDGTRALYLVLEAQQVQVARWQQPPEDLPPGAPLALLGVPFADDAALERLDGGSVEAGGRASEPVERKELDTLLERVHVGGTLLYAPASVRSNQLLQTLGVRLVQAPGPPGLRTLVPAQPSAFTLGVERLEAPLAASLEALPDDAVPLLVDEGQRLVVAALVPHGQGRVLVLAAPELLTNRYLALADNARFGTSLMRGLGAGQSALIDEYHHGFTSRRSMGEFAGRYGLEYAAAQLLLGLMLWALSLRRLGAAAQPARQLRVGATDALAALSRIYREGQHHGHAAACLLQGLCADLAPRAGVATASDPAEVARGLRARGRPALAQALLDLAARAGGVGSDRELLALARLAALARRMTS
jgi:Domain of unknown function (DUF4350)